MKIYLIGSLKNEKIPDIAGILREKGFEVFDEWYSPGPDADDYWKEYEKGRGWSYTQALNHSLAAKNIFDFDKKHIDSSDVGILVLPCGKSGHLELGYMIGQGKLGYILLDETPKLPEKWQWVAGLYEGEGSISYNKGRDGNPQNLVLSLTSTDKDTIEKLYLITEVGKTQGPYFNKGNNLIKKGEFKPQWRWTVYKKEDILYVLKGIFDLLGERRQKQIKDTFKKIGLSIEEMDKVEGPQEFRYDIMYKFAAGVFTSLEDLLARLQFVYGIQKAEEREYNR